MASIGVQATKLAGDVKTALTNARRQTVLLLAEGIKQEVLQRSKVKVLPRSVLAEIALHSQWLTTNNISDEEFLSGGFSALVEQQAKIGAADVIDDHETELGLSMVSAATQPTAYEFPSWQAAKAFYQKFAKQIATLELQSPPYTVWMRGGSPEMDAEARRVGGARRGQSPAQPAEKKATITVLPEKILETIQAIERAGAKVQTHTSDGAVNFFGPPGIVDRLVKQFSGKGASMTTVAMSRKDRYMASLAAAQPAPTEEPVAPPNSRRAKYLRSKYAADVPDGHVPSDGSIPAKVWNRTGQQAPPGTKKPEAAAAISPTGKRASITFPTPDQATAFTREADTLQPLVNVVEARGNKVTLFYDPAHAQSLAALKAAARKHGAGAVPASNAMPKKCAHCGHPVE